MLLMLHKYLCEFLMGTIMAVGFIGDNVDVPHRYLYMTVEFLYMTVEFKWTPDLDS